MAAAPPPTFPPTPESKREFLPETFRGLVQFLTTGIPPPTAAYVGRDDVLFVRAWSAVSGANIQTTLRLLLPSGEIIAQVFNDVPTPDRVATNFSHPLAEGFVLSMVVNNTGTVVRRGQVFVTAFLFRGTSVNPFSGQVLLSDYLANNNVLGWPYPLIRQSAEGPGALRSITGTLPAAGAEISEIVPTGARWHLRSLSVLLTTSATVATRTPQFLLDDGAQTFYQVPSPSGQAASLSQRYTFAPTGRSDAAVIGDVMMAAPIDTKLFGGARIRTSTASLQVGDQWTAPQYEVEEWIET